MSKQAEADLILKLYDLRREPAMRKARDWYMMNFFPNTLEDFNQAMSLENGTYVRMVNSYWEMAASLVKHGAIDIELFNDTNAEHVAVFGRMEPILEEYRAQWGPKALSSLERLVDSTPGGRQRSAQMREGMLQWRDKLAASAEA